MERTENNTAAPGRLGLAAAGTGATAAGLLRLGRLLPGTLPEPLDPAALQHWLTATPIDAVAVRGLWAAAIGAAAYLTVVQAFGCAAAATGSLRGLHLADRLSGGLVRRLSVTGLAAGLGVAAVGAPGGAQTAPAPTPAAPGRTEAPTAPTMRLTAETGPTTAATAPTMTLDTGAPSMRLEAGAPAMHLEAGPPAPASIDPHPVTPTAPIAVGLAGDIELEAPIITTGLGVWIVRPGDNLWSIAEAVLQQRAGTPADLEAVEAYWHRLVETNRPNLADPTNPDLLFTGQQLSLPLR